MNENAMVCKLFPRACSACLRLYALGREGGARLVAHRWIRWAKRKGILGEEV